MEGFVVELYKGDTQWFYKFCSDWPEEQTQFYHYGSKLCRGYDLQGNLFTTKISQNDCCFELRIQFPHLGVNTFTSKSSWSCCICHSSFSLAFLSEWTNLEIWSFSFCLLECFPCFPTSFQSFGKHCHEDIKIFRELNALYCFLEKYLLFLTLKWVKVHFSSSSAISLWRSLGQWILR